MEFNSETINNSKQNKNERSMLVQTLPTIQEEAAEAVKTRLYLRAYEDAREDFYMSGIKNPSKPSYLP